MTTRSKLLACLPGVVAAMALTTTGANAQCVFSPALTTQTTCVTAIAIPGNPLRSFDISFVNEKRGEYYFADRSNSAVQVIDIKTLTCVLVSRRRPARNMTHSHRRAASIISCSTMAWCSPPSS